MNELEDTRVESSCLKRNLYFKGRPFILTVYQGQVRQQKDRQKESDTQHTTAGVAG